MNRSGIEILKEGLGVQDEPEVARISKLVMAIDRAFHDYCGAQGDISGDAQNAINETWDALEQAINKAKEAVQPE